MSGGRLQAVLYKGRYLCCSVRQGDTDLKFVRSGNKVGSVAGLSLLVRRIIRLNTLCGLLLSLLTKVDELLTEKVTARS